MCDHPDHVDDYFKGREGIDEATAIANWDDIEKAGWTKYARHVEED